MAGEAARLARSTAPAFGQDLQDARQMLAALVPGHLGAAELPILHCAAAADSPDVVTAALAAGLGSGELARCLHIFELRQAFGSNPALLRRLDACQGLLGSALVCPVALAAALGHHRALSALLAAGAQLSVCGPLRPPSWHPLAAAALSAEAAGWCAGSGWDAAAVDAAEGAGLASCRLLLQAGADVAEAVSSHSAGSPWLLNVDSQPLLRLLLAALTERCAAGWRPRYDTCRTLLLAAATADAPAAYRAFAAVLPGGCPPTEYGLLAGEVVTLARRSGQLVLGCMAQQAATAGVAPAGGEAAEGGAEAAPSEAAPQEDDAAAAAAPPADPLAVHLAAELAACLEAAAADSQLSQLTILLRAGVPASAGAVRAAVTGGHAEALAGLLRDGAPPVEPLPPGTVLALPSGVDAGAGATAAYTCPLLTLLHVHAREGRDELHAGSLAMAGQLAAAGYRPAAYTNVLVRRAGEEQARLLPRFDPLLEDEGLRAAGSGRFVCLAATHTPWCPATAARFPPAVQRAARTLLLAARRGASAPHLASLARMPSHLHEEILARAAFPLSEVASAPWQAAASWLAGW